MNTMKTLAERAVASKHWRWMPGMLALDSCNEEHLRVQGVRPPARVIDARRSVVYEDSDGAMHEGVVSRSDVPDLTDPATLGCLLALVREAWEPHRGDDPVCCTHQCLDGEWGVGSWVSTVFAAVCLPVFDTEAEALVAALEAGELT
jgi:hypothetical protein